MFDLFVLTCAVIGTGVGFYRGLAIQLAGIASLILGFGLGAPLAKSIVAAYDGETPFQGLVIFVVCFCVIALICYGLAIKLREWLKEKELKQWDKQVGGLVGLFHGLFVSLVLTFIALVIAPGTAPDYIKNSNFIKPMRKLSGQFTPSCPAKPRSPWNPSSSARRAAKPNRSILFTLPGIQRSTFKDTIQTAGKSKSGILPLDV